MARPDAIVGPREFGDLAQRSEGLGPARVLGRELLDDPGVFCSDIALFLGVGLEIEQMPIILGVLFVEPPILPTHRNQVSSFGVPGFVVQPEKILVRFSFVLSG